MHPRGWPSQFSRDRTVTVGRARSSDIRVGHELVQGRWTVSKCQIELRWDGTRWSSVNLSDKAGLLQVYEPGYEPVLLEPGRQWAPVRHRWCYDIGRPDHPFHVVCHTDDHKGPAVLWGQPSPRPASLPRTTRKRLCSKAWPHSASPYWSGTSCLPITRGSRSSPRPLTLEPRSHKEAARRLGRSQDSTRKAIERVNEKIQTISEAPAIATGRNVSGEIGRWLARTGILDPDLLDGPHRGGLDRDGPHPGGDAE